MYKFERSRPWSRALKRCLWRRMGPWMARGQSQKSAHNWTGGRPGVRSVVRPRARRPQARFKVTSFIIITLNLQFNSMCRKKKHSLIHWSTWMYQSPLTPIRTWCKKSALTIIGMSTRTEVCQIREQNWRNSFYWKRNLLKDICGPGRDWHDYETRSCVAWRMNQHW